MGKRSTSCTGSPLCQDGIVVVKLTKSERCRVVVFLFYCIRYQWTDDVAIRNSTFFRIKTAVYYSRSCNNTLIEGSTFNECVNGVIGALQSDNDCTDIQGNAANERIYPFCVTSGRDFTVLFGVARAHNLTVRDCRFTGSRRGTPLQIGAVADARVTGCVFERNDNVGIAISRGGRPVDVPNARVVIEACRFASTNNREGTVHLLHPAILVMGPQPKIDLAVRGCTFELAQREQAFGVVFAGGHAYGDVCLGNNTFVTDEVNFGGRGIVFEGNGVVPDSRLADLLQPTFHVCRNVVHGTRLGPHYEANRWACPQNSSCGRPPPPATTTSTTTTTTTTTTATTTRTATTVTTTTTTATTTTATAAETTVPIATTAAATQATAPPASSSAAPPPVSSSGPDFRAPPATAAGAEGASNGGGDTLLAGATGGSATAARAGANHSGAEGGGRTTSVTAASAPRATVAGGPKTGPAANTTPAPAATPGPGEVAGSSGSGSDTATVAGIVATVVLCLVCAGAAAWARYTMAPESGGGDGGGGGVRESVLGGLALGSSGRDGFGF